VALTESCYLRWRTELAIEKTFTTFFWVCYGIGILLSPSTLGVEIIAFFPAEVGIEMSRKAVSRDPKLGRNHQTEALALRE